MRQLSEVMLRALHAQETGEVLLPLIVVEAEGWPGPERFAGQTWTDVISGGQTYFAVPFRVGLPDESDDDDAGEIELSIDNVSRDIGRALRLATGSISVTLSFVLASQPDVVDIGPLEFDVLSHKTTSQDVVLVLAASPLTDQVFGQHVLNTVNAPGLHS